MKARKLKPRPTLQGTHTPACALVLPHGQAKYENRRKVCLSENQVKTLFGGKRPRQLGCGMFACAWTSPKRGTVVKITNDASDVGSLLKAQGSPYVPRVDAAYELWARTAWIDKPITSEYSRRPYAVVVEKLKPVKDETDVLRCFGVRVHRKGLAKAYEDCCTAGGESIKYASQDFAQKRLAFCPVVAQPLVHAITDLHQRGIKWTDIHAGNVGFDSKGNLKVLDIGLTNEHANVPQLAGRRRKRP